jgi:hypothetical protein
VEEPAVPGGNVNGISDGFHTYSYDADGNLTQVDGGATARYLYNSWLVPAVFLGPGALDVS